MKPKQIKLKFSESWWNERLKLEKNKKNNDNLLKLDKLVVDIIEKTTLNDKPVWYAARRCSNSKIARFGLDNEQVRIYCSQSEKASGTLAVLFVRFHKKGADKQTTKDINDADKKLKEINTGKTRWLTAPEDYLEKLKKQIAEREKNNAKQKKSSKGKSAPVTESVSDKKPAKPSVQKAPAVKKDTSGMKPKGNWWVASEVEAFLTGETVKPVRAPRILKLMQEFLKANKMPGKIEERLSIRNTPCVCINPDCVFEFCELAGITLKEKQDNNKQSAQETKTESAGKQETSGTTTKQTSDVRGQPKVSAKKAMVDKIIINGEEMDLADVLTQVDCASLEFLDILYENYKLEAIDHMIKIEQCKQEIEKRRIAIKSSEILQHHLEMLKLQVKQNMEKGSK